MNLLDVVSPAVGAFVGVIVLDYIARKVEIKVLSQGMYDVKVSKF
tara:strand:+ start:40 stop:174 length:135 start_codon:yes stop_codon:yes gene_type:complete